MEKLKMHSPDLTQENIAKIRELFPGCVTEAHDEATDAVRLAVDFDQLRQELSDHIVEGPQERYRLDWPGKREALLAANAPIARTLRPKRDESVNFDATQNLFIEGDNLEAMKLCKEGLLSCVRCIYIDPPYNTGGDFVYRDDFVEDVGDFLIRSCQKNDVGERLVANPESSGRYHSDWLSMMYSRLRLARLLLAENGVIFISIDVLELANLMAIGKEVFGQHNCIGVIARSTGTRMGTGSRGIARELDYIVAFSKQSDGALRGLPMTESEVAIYDQEDERGRYLTRSLRRTGGENRREDRPSMFYPVISPDGEEVFPIAPEGYESRWVCSRETYKKLLDDGLIEWKKISKNGKQKWQVYQKHYLRDAVKESSDLWVKAEGNKKATKEVAGLFGKIKIFDHPKPLDAICRIIQMGTSESSKDIVLDFFGGSGTTAAAVLRQNAIDGGNRRFILVQLDEPVDDKSEAHKAGFSCISDIAKERIRRAGAKILEGDSHTDWNRDVGFRVLKIDTSNMQDVYYRPDEVDQKGLLDAVDNIKPDRTPEDLLFQVLVDWGVDLTLPISRETVQGKTVFFVDENALVACFDTGITEELVKELAKREPLRVVFRDNGFVSDAVKINVEQIFRQLSPTTEVKSI
jgi:adenine-specific DNA-methyltransferase